LSGCSFTSHPMDLVGPGQGASGRPRDVRWSFSATSGRPRDEHTGVDRLDPDLAARIACPAYSPGACFHPGYYHKTVTAWLPFRNHHAWYFKRCFGHNAWWEFGNMPQTCRNAQPPGPCVRMVMNSSKHKGPDSTSESGPWCEAHLRSSCSVAGISRRRRRPTGRCRGRHTDSPRRQSAVHGSPGPDARHKQNRPRCSRWKCRIAGPRNNRCRC